MNIPPPLPPAPKKSRIWILFVLLGVFALLVVAGIAAVGVFAVRKAQEQRVALNEMQQKFADERVKTADAIRNGDEASRTAAGQRLTADLRNAASHLNSADAAAARGMASWAEKMQAQGRDLQAQGERLRAAKIFTFDLPDRATIEEKRKIARDFVASNSKLTDMILRAQELAGAELDAAGTPVRTREAALAGYAQEADKIRPTLLTIRQCDQTIGESALSLLDLLDQNWGKWHRDEKTGQLRFKDDATLNAYNGFIRKVQAASSEEKTAEQTLAQKMKGKSAAASGVPAVPGATPSAAAPVPPAPTLRQ